MATFKYLLKSIGLSLYCKSPYQLHLAAYYMSTQQLHMLPHVVFCFVCPLSLYIYHRPLCHSILCDLDDIGVAIRRIGCNVAKLFELKLRVCIVLANYYRHLIVQSNQSISWPIVRYGAILTKLHKSKTSQLTNLMNTQSQIQS